MQPIVLRRAKTGLVGLTVAIPLYEPPQPTEPDPLPPPPPARCSIPGHFGWRRPPPRPTTS